jgi:hypothetical protein
MNRFGLIQPLSSPTSRRRRALSLSTNAKRNETKSHYFRFFQKENKIEFNLSLKVTITTTTTTNKNSSSSTTTTTTMNNIIDNNSDKNERDSLDWSFNDGILQNGLREMVVDNQTIINNNEDDTVSFFFLY